MTFNEWNINWPGLLSGKTTIRLPVKFELELDRRSTRNDCRIGQVMKGRVQHRADPALPDDFSRLRGDLNENDQWTQDGPLWWDGSQWNGGVGSWHMFSLNETATFYDEPGFNEAEQSSYPLYWGGVRRQGHFEFKTYVKDANLTPVRDLQWGLLIDYTAPKVGSHYFYK